MDRDYRYFDAAGQRILDTGTMVQKFNTTGNFLDSHYLLLRATDATADTTDDDMSAATSAHRPLDWWLRWRADREQRERTSAVIRQRISPKMLASVNVIENFRELGGIVADLVMNYQLTGVEPDVLGPLSRLTTGLKGVLEYANAGDW